jgi:hypothetical protein
VLYHMSHACIHFAVFILDMGVSLAICQGWPWTSSLPISASQVARITGVSHQRPASVALLSR